MTIFFFFVVVFFLVTELETKVVVLKATAKFKCTQQCHNELYVHKWHGDPFYTPPHNSGGVLWFHVGCLSVRRMSVCPSFFSFPDDNLSKHQWSFTKLGMCIDIVEIWYGIANGQISSNFYGVICLRHAHIFVSGR